MTPPSLTDLRRYAISRSLFKPTTLPKAIARLGFVQADPIRAPARAQDLTLRHRVIDYRAGDLERRYPRLPIEEDFFVNYGFVPRELHALMHPRTARQPWTKARWKKAHDGAGVRARARRRASARGGRALRARQGDELVRRLEQRVDAAARRHALPRAAAHRAPRRRHPALCPREATPTPADVRRGDGRAGRRHRRTSTRRCRRATCRSSSCSCARRAALARGAQGRAGARQGAAAAARRSTASTWYWPAGERPALAPHRVTDDVRLFSPFDPVVWDRQRFEIFWGWPIASRPTRRRRNACAATTRCRCCGATRSSAGEICRSSTGRLVPSLGYVRGRAPREPAFKRALEAELARMTMFLGLEGVRDGRLATE